MKSIPARRASLLSVRAHNIRLLRMVQPQLTPEMLVAQVRRYDDAPFAGHCGNKRCRCCSIDRHEKRLARKRERRARKSLDSELAAE